jgi:Transposase DDE domain
VWGRRIVAAQDTTEVNFSGRDRGRHDLGPAGDGKSLGFFCHGMVAIDADEEAVLGVVDAQIWTRPDEPAPEQRSQSIEAKESIRWINASAVAADLLAGAAQLIIVGDRENDIYAQFARRPAGADLIVRAAQNRKLADDAKLFDAPSTWHAFGATTIKVPPSRPGEAGRVAIVEIKAGEVCIRKPRDGAAEDAATVTLTYVEVRETAPPAGHKPIIWRLLTTLKVVGQADEFAAAQEIVRLYRLRWRIEQVFRAMKSDGLRLEETQIKEAERLFKIAAIALIAAVRTIQLVDARDGSPRPATDVADPEQIAAAEVIRPTLEGKTARQKNPHPPRSLAWLSWIAARLGGWNCYYKPPGPKTMRNGWNRLAAMAEGYALAIARKNV